MSETPAVFVNVFAVEPGQLDELLAVLREGLEGVVSGRPGFMSAELLVDPSGTRVINVARWRTAADAAATQQDPVAATFAARTAALVSSSQPGIFRIEHSTR